MPGRERREDRVEPLDDRRPRRRSSGSSRARARRRRRWCRRRRSGCPDAASCCGAADVVAVVRVAAVDDDVAGLEMRHQLRRAPRRRRRPAPSARSRAAASCFATRSASVAAPIAPSFCKRGDRRRLHVVDDALMPFGQQATHHAGAHPAEADHCELHCCPPDELCGSAQRRPGIAAIAVPATRQLPPTICGTIGRTRAQTCCCQQNKERTCPTRWINCASTPSAPCRSMPCRRPTAATPACRSAPRRWPTCCGRDFLKHNPRNPHWPDRDRFVLSAGHGSMLLYSLLHLTGYDLSLDELKQLPPVGQQDARPPGARPHAGRRSDDRPARPGLRQRRRHGDRRGAPGGALQPARARRSSTTTPTASSRDGDLMEGVASEAASLAGHLQLGKLIYLYDDNQITLAGTHRHHLHRGRRRALRGLRLAHAAASTTATTSTRSTPALRRRRGPRPSGRR